MGRGAIAGGVVAAAGVAAAAWFFLLGGGGAPRGESRAGDEEAAAEAGPAGAPSLASRAKPASAPAARLADFRAKGKVVDAAGKPLPDLRVTARRTGAVWDQSDPTTWGEGPLGNFRKALERYDAPSVEEPKPTVEGTSSAEGTFDLTLPEAGSYELKAWPAAPRVAFPATVQVTVVRPSGTATIVVATGAALRVRVVDAKDLPVTAVVDGWWTLDDRQRGWSLPRRRTDATTGEVSWDAVPAGTGTLSVVVPGRGSYGGVEVKTPREAVLVVRIGGLGTLKGRVTDVEGKPVAGVDLTVATGKGAATEVPGTGVVRARTEADGTYRSDAAWPGKVTQVTAFAEGFTLLSQSPPRAPWSGAEVKEGAETTLDLVLARGAIVAGRVTEAGTGAAVPDVELTLLRSTRGGEWAGIPARATTDAEGRYRFDDVPLGKHVLFPRSKTHWFPAIEAARGPMSYSGGPAPSAPPSVFVVLSKEGETQERDLEMTRGLSVRGRVLGPDGSPVAGADVREQGMEVYNVAWRWGVQWSGGAGQPLATSGEDGTFTAGGLAPRPDWTFSASKGALSGVPSDPVALVAGGPTPEVTLRMVTGASIEGRVVDGEGKPLPGATVWFWGTSSGSWGGNNVQGTTDVDGAFLLEGLPTGKGQLQVNVGMRSVQKPIEEGLAAGEVRRGVEIKLAAGLEVSGVVVDEDGKPVPGLFLSAQSADGTGSRASSPTRADGAFTLSGLAAGKTTINAQEPRSDGVYTARAIGEGVTVPSTGLRLTYKAKKTTPVVVRVTDPDGRPVPLCSVKVGPPPSQDTYYGPGQSSDEVVNGETRREVEGSPPWKVTASGARDARGQPMNLKSKSGEIADPAATLTLQLEPGAEISGVVVGPDAKGVEGVAVSGGGTTATSDALGRWRLGGLAGPAGEPVDLVAKPPSRWQTPAGTKARPGDADVKFVLAPGGFVAGQVLGPDGKPVPQCSVSGQWRSPASSGSGGVHANPDVNGRFRLEGFPVDALVTLQVQAWSMTGASTFVIARVKDVPSGKDDVVVRLVEGVKIEGRVLSADGTKPANAWIQASRADGFEGEGGSTARWNDDGTFELSGLAPGPYNVTVSGSTGTALTEPRRVDAPAKGIDITIPVRSKVAGRIEGDGDLKGFSVWAWPAASRAPHSSQPAASAQVDDTGAFTLDLPADAEVMLAAFRKDDDRYAVFGPVRAGTSGAGASLRLAAGASIDGTLEDAAGAPVTSGWVSAQADHFQTYAQTDDRGRFRIRGLPPGRYQLASWVGKMQSLGEADAGATGLRLKVSK